MSLVSVTTTETNVKELQFSIDKDTFEKSVDEVYKKKAPKMSVPGFRKGKAPRSIIEKIYGKGVFFEEALNAVIPDAYEAAEKEAELRTVGRPEFDVVSLDDNGVVMKAVVTVYPEVTVKDYRGIAVDKKVKEVTDADIDAEIDRVRERNAREIEVEDRPAELNDTVTIDFDGSVDGVAFEGGHGENHPLKLGSGQFIPGFEEQVVGKSIGDSFDVSVTFPTDYQAEDLAGKAAVFACKLHAIKKSLVPAADDDFAKDVSEFDTFDEYRKDVAAKMKEDNEKSAERDVEESIIGTLIEHMEAEIPEVMFENELEGQIKDFDNRLRQQGMELSMYLKYTSMTEESMKEQFRPNAEKQVKARLALEAVVKAENIEATEDEITAEITKLAEAYHMEADQIRSFIDPHALSSDICVQKAMKLIRESAVITEAKAD